MTGDSLDSRDETDHKRTRELFHHRFNIRLASRGHQNLEKKEGMGWGGGSGEE